MDIRRRKAAVATARSSDGSSRMGREFFSSHVGSFFFSGSSRTVHRRVASAGACWYRRCRRRARAGPGSAARRRRGRPSSAQASDPERRARARAAGVIDKGSPNACVSLEVWNIPPMRVSKNDESRRGRGACLNRGRGHSRRTQPVLFLLCLTEEKKYTQRKCFRCVYVCVSEARSSSAESDLPGYSGHRHPQIYQLCGVVKRQYSPSTV